MSIRNLSRQLRAQCVDLFAAYKARVRIVYLETTEEKLLQQNREREDRVPLGVISKLLDRWEVPDVTEAQPVDWVVREE